MGTCAAQELSRLPGGFSFLLRAITDFIYHGCSVAACRRFFSCPSLF
ncbi:hypothetical protein BN137_2378 [Cronobacter condimenti 1330]|uniref:Uncharacterized protein n=1 Tax=Cronobacter condimenti 1330 TaxID=1073999 RepID=K8AFI8_9ENTR|nr:hypothetical protein BN137_2378 [Cronobacter condimenti 1330]